MDQIYKLNIFTGIYCVICRENLQVFEGWIQSHSCIIMMLSTVWPHVPVCTTLKPRCSSWDSRWCPGPYVLDLGLNMWTSSDFVIQELWGWVLPYTRRITATGTTEVWVWYRLACGRLCNLPRMPFHTITLWPSTKLVMLDDVAGRLFHACH